jgi:hypothetical protein
MGWEKGIDGRKMGGRWERGNAVTVQYVCISPSDRLPPCGKTSLQSSIPLFPAYLPTSLPTSLPTFFPPTYLPRTDCLFGPLLLPHELDALLGMRLHRHGRAVRHIVQAIVGRVVQRLANLVLPSIIWDLVVSLKEYKEASVVSVSCERQL